MHKLSTLENKLCDLIISAREFGAEREKSADGPDTVEAEAAEKDAMKACVRQINRLLPVLAVTHMPPLNLRGHGGIEVCRVRRIVLNGHLMATLEEGRPSTDYARGSRFDALMRSEVERYEKALGVKAVHPVANS